MTKHRARARTKARPKTRRQPRRTGHKARAIASRAGWTIGPISYGPPLGDGVVQAPLEAVLSAIEAHADLDWTDAAPLLLPVIPRVRAYPPGSPAPLIAMLPPGVATGFGIDVGPAFMNVTRELAATWGVGVTDLAARAVANVHDRAEGLEPSAIHLGSLGGVQTEWLQTGRSIGSTLIFAPYQLERLFGPRARLFITPMRDLIIGLPGGVDPELALWLHAEIASQDPNCLGPTGYRFDGAAITPVQLDLDLGASRAGHGAMLA